MWWAQRVRDGRILMFDPHDLIGDLRRLSTGVTSVNFDSGTRKSIHSTLMARVGDQWGRKRLGRRGEFVVVVVGLCTQKELQFHNHQTPSPS